MKNIEGRATTKEPLNHAQDFGMHEVFPKHSMACTRSASPKCMAVNTKNNNVVNTGKK